MNLFKHLAVMVVITLLAACGEEPPPRYHGFLYFGAGGYLGKLSLRDGSSSVVSSVGNANIREVDELYGERLLLALDAIENDREVAKITWLDVRSLQDTTLFGGVAAVWVPEVHTYIYDDGSRLAAASTHPDYVTDAVIMDHRLNDVVEILVVSGTTILFQTGYAERGRVWQYDVENAELSSLEQLTSVCLLRHSAWILERNLLACKSSQTGNYILVTPDGEVESELTLPAEREFEAIEYIADQRLLVFSEPWRSALGGQVRNGVWVYELDSGAVQRIAEHQYLGNSTAYRRE